jgi:hypothetical protein
MKLFMLVLGCRPAGRNTEQHDVFFGIGNTLQDLLPSIKKFWKDGGTIHIDSWREVTHVDNFRIEISPEVTRQTENLYFINLGGYKPNDPEEYHYKVLAVSETLAGATKTAKSTAFFKHCSAPGAPSHIDDKFGIDVDDVAKVADILPSEFSNYHLHLIPATEEVTKDILHIGYLPLTKVKNLA